MAKITQKFIESLKPTEKDIMARDDTLTGFGVKVLSSGRKSFFVEGRIRGGGRTRRITLGQYPAMDLVTARDLAREKLQLMQKGVDPVVQAQRETARREALNRSFGDVFENYLLARELKDRTRQDYKNAVNLYFQDWLTRPIRDITRQDCEHKFIRLRENSGLATASKALRIISAVFNFAKADEVDGERLLTDNPADVIKQKRYSRTLKPRMQYLDKSKIARLIYFEDEEKDRPVSPPHGVTDQGMNLVMLLLFSGLRKSEALRLRWDHIKWDKEYFVIPDTKNKTDHYVPLSRLIKATLKKQRKYLERIGKDQSPWVFPAVRGDGHMTEPKTQLKRICAATNLQFRFHDLRRTFATHAEANGVPFELIRKALNHKSNSVTDSYIITQINSLRKVFDTLSDSYHKYYDPEWGDEPLEGEDEEPGPPIVFYDFTNQNDEQ